MEEFALPGARPTVSSGSDPRAEPAGFGHLRRREWLALALLSATPLARAAAKTTVDVWKSPTCGCCGDWMKLMEAAGFQMKVHDTGNVAIRKGLRMADKYGSCHTALVDGYAIEGHVPVRDVKRLLRERPKAVGLAVPGMPIGSAGMDGPAYAGRRDPYDVLLVQRDGTSAVFQAYR
ncbi:MAG: DUF411 domain-containing protein [Rubrivivax sp.]|nr:DUF411 domain-containing protein [Rubrivivax sp.]